MTAPRGAVRERARKMSGYRLYGGGVTQAASVEAVLAELDLPYRLEPVDILKGEHRTEAFRNLNPAGFVPVLVTPDGTVLHENSGIMLYLADLHPDAGLVPRPEDPLRGRLLSRLLFLNNEIQSRSKCYFYPHRWSSDPEDAPRIRRAAVETLMKNWRLYDRWLTEDGPYALGERFSIADIYMALWAGYGLDGVEDITGQFPAVARCHEAIITREKAGPIIASVRSAILRWRQAGGEKG